MKSIFSSRKTGPRLPTSISLALVMMTSAACHGQTAKPGTTGTPAATDRAQMKAPMGTRIELALTGYNYTNRYIDQFDVDGQGGGNIGVSGPNTAGNGSACCVSYRSGAKARKVKIRWQRDACTYNERISGGETFNDIYLFFKEVEVQVDADIPDNPRYFEVHIYPDGHAEAAITEHESRARLALNKDREDNTHFPRCPDGKKPIE
jgi:hypothetical protein